MSTFSAILASFLAVLFPPRCHSCKASIRDGRDLHFCDRCRGGLVRVVQPLCGICGVPFHVTSGGIHVCGRCLTAPPPFWQARAALMYEGQAKELIHRLKYGQKIQLSLPLGLITAEYLSEYIIREAPDLIIPVPLHGKRVRGRGFNQALLIAEVLAREWHLPLLRHTLKRTRWTEPQVNLSREERRRNVRGAFKVAAPERVQGKKIVLVDDVYTTGSTAAECASTLAAAGAESTIVVTVARVAD